MVKMKRGGFETEPYFYNDKIFVKYQLQFRNDLIVPGTVIKFKHERDTFRFRCLAHNIEKDVTWIDCINTKTLQWHSFYVDKLKGVVKPKRSRRHKPNHE